MAGRSSRALIRKRKAPRRPPIRAGGWGRVPSLLCRRSCLLLSLLLFPAPQSSGFPVRAPSRPRRWRRVWPRSRRPLRCLWVAPLAWMRSCGRPFRRRACACFPSRRSPGRAASRAALSPPVPSRSCARWAPRPRRSSPSRRARAPLGLRLLPLRLLVSVARVPVRGRRLLSRRVPACRVSSLFRPAWLCRPVGVFRPWAPLAVPRGSRFRRPFLSRFFSWAPAFAPGVGAPAARPRPKPQEENNVNIPEKKEF